MGREITAEAVRNQTFGRPPLGRRGYREDEVDAFLQVIAAALDGGRRLSADEVDAVVFSKPRLGGQGYDEEQVDAFLDLVEAHLRTEQRYPGTAMSASAAAAEPLDDAGDAPAADAAWFEARFGSTRTPTTTPHRRPTADRRGAASNDPQLPSGTHGRALAVMITLLILSLVVGALAGAFVLTASFALYLLIPIGDLWWEDAKTRYHPSSPPRWIKFAASSCVVTGFVVALLGAAVSGAG